MTCVTHGALGYVSYQKGIIQGHLVYGYTSRRAPALFSRIVFRTVLSLDVSTQTVFLYYMSVKYTSRGYFWRFCCSCYALVVMSNRLNQYNFSTLHRLYIWGHRWILVLLLIYVNWCKHSNTNIVGFKCILNLFWRIIWRSRAIFDHSIKCLFLVIQQAEVLINVECIWVYITVGKRLTNGAKSRIS